MEAGVWCESLLLRLQKDGNVVRNPTEHVGIKLSKLAVRRTEPGGHLEACW